ncbi:F0F1 ATP synthase subunit delta [Domibacillus sp. DTU_2020_1001157_1_SI_ALB_TIR_016]|uniref:F0F1 ATP synthase subunit delta n=1 Tax=Domibacillus sp. DTU_2020_1001157_1_SI_ALB_TIR_016 TaxID=3077789 RepID=UPI0028EE390F|nr:F0F1 ATP synthase subunit delta [Domibacillus sp. DTU_2020_1001157_1_SI_ALB_TIR_016]WNS81122.1 F0F1 ATP synthase subunit delta [Domibacillus sp. DTU_2020_1001157_1_SI_ALB_TIR_016]
MSKSGAAKRYAIALFELAKENNQVAKFDQEVRIVKEVIEENGEVAKALESPNLSLADKQALVNTLAAHASTAVLNTLKLLVERRRADEIGTVCEEFIQLSNQERGMAEAIVYSARPLTEAEAASVSQTFARKVGKQTLTIENIVDSNVLGGLKVRIGNRIFDGTLQGKLDRLQKQLTTNL